MNKHLIHHSPTNFFFNEFSVFNINGSVGGAMVIGEKSLNRNIKRSKSQNENYDIDEWFNLKDYSFIDCTT